MSGNGVGCVHRRSLFQDGNNRETTSRRSENRQKQNPTPGESRKQNSTRKQNSRTEVLRVRTAKKNILYNTYLNKEQCCTELCGCAVYRGNLLSVVRSSAPQPDPESETRESTDAFVCLTLCYSASRCNRVTDGRLDIRFCYLVFI